MTYAGQKFEIDLINLRKSHTWKIREDLQAALKNRITFHIMNIMLNKTLIRNLHKKLD